MPQSALLILPAVCCCFILPIPRCSVGGQRVTMRSAHWATVIIAACIVAATYRRGTVALGRPARADLGAPAVIAARFAALPIRGLLFATVRARRCFLPCRFSMASPPPYLRDGPSSSPTSRAAPAISISVRYSRHRDRDRSVTFGDARRLYHRPLRQSVSFCFARRDRRRGLRGAVALMPETRPEQQAE